MANIIGKNKYQSIIMLMTKNENEMIVSEDENFVPKHGLTMIEDWIYSAQRYVDGAVVVFNSKDNHNRYAKSDGTYELLKASPFILDVFKNPIENLSFVWCSR